MRKTIVFDFDGVIHSYKSEWQGLLTIPDEPVPGIREVMTQLMKDGYEVVIVSTRSSSQEGIDSMTEWLNKHDIPFDYISDTKPPAMVYVDDRAIRFDGNTENLVQEIEEFVPWTQRGE